MATWYGYSELETPPGNMSMNNEMKMSLAQIPIKA
jgi:hypothetical protein